MSSQNLDIDKVKPLDDIPVKEDELRGKSHQNVANALVNLISKNEGGHAIGLEGSWGSGKSSVISIAENLFKKQSKKYLFYTFDAWAHSGDPIRRSFLECLFGFLESKKIVTVRDWSVRLRKIRAQEKRVTSETVPKIPGFNYVMVVYGLLLPFLIIWANDYYDSNNLKTLLFPTLVIVGIPIICALFTKWYRKNHGSDEFKNIPILPSTRYLNHKSKTEQFIHTVDATTIEFNRYFDDLIKRLKNKEKKLIVVVDNLDRLSSDDVKSMWGTMRNFFTSEYWGERQKLLKNVYLVVPYDLPYISKVFSEENNKNDSRSIDGFIDKTFKYNFQVSAPILMDWKTYFEEKLDQAFGKQLTDKQKFDLYKLFEFKFQTDKHSITPRRIKKFINELVVQVIEWENEIPIKFLALYVLHRNEIKVNPRKVLEQEIIQDERTRNYLEGVDWVKFIVAAYYKVNPDSALQIVMGNIIKQALVNSDKNGELKKLQEEYDWFEYILNLVVENNSQEWAKSEPITFSTVAKTLDGLEISSTHISESIWDNLAYSMNYLKQIGKPNSELSRGFSLILKHTSDKHFERAAKKVFSILFPEIKDDTDVKEYAKNYADYIFTLYKSCTKRVDKKRAISFLGNISFPNNTRFNVHFAAQTQLLNIGFQNFKSSAFKIEGFNKEIKEIISNESIEEELEQSVRAFLVAGKKLDWDGIAQVLINRINTNQPALSSYELGIFLLILFLMEFHSKGEAGKKLNKLSNDGILTALIDKAKGDELTTSLIILQLLKYYERIDDIQQNAKVPTYGNNNAGLNLLKKICGNSTENPQIVKHIADYGCEFSFFQEILDAVEPNKSSYPLIEEVAIRMIEDGCIKGLDVFKIIENFDSVRFIYEDEKEERFFKLVDQQNFDINQISSLGIISIDVLNELIELKTELGSNLVDKVKNDLTALDPEQWTPLLEQEDHEIGLLITIIENNSGPFLAEDFSKALLDVSTKILEEEITLQKYKDKWKYLPKSLAPNTRSTFYERLFAKAVQYREKGVFHLLSLFDDEFIQSVKIEDKADPFIKNVVSDLINSDDIQQLSWVEDNIDVVVKSYKKSEKETRQYLKEIIESKHNEEAKVKEKIRIISDKLSIAIKWDEKEIDSKDEDE
ncbi:MAG: P-loop NTPase fold protein [Candidatus Paceibacterota bacterium]